MSEPNSNSSRSAPIVIMAVVATLLLVGASWAVAWFVFDWPRGNVVVNKPAPAPVPVEKDLPHDALWLQDFAAAKEKAARENKDILLSFEGSDWCIWCQR